MLPNTPIEDQRGQSHTLDDSVRLVLMSRDMEAGEVIREALREAGPDALERHAAVYVSDISGMPSLIAIPRMRERPYILLLDRDGQFTGAFPAEPGKATLLFVERRRIREISHTDDVTAVLSALYGASHSAPR